MKGKTCIITGATSGIGRASALEFAMRGASLVLIGRNEARGREVVARIRRYAPAGKVDFLRCDLTIQENVQNVAKAIRGMAQSIDVLVNNAGARFDEFGKNAEGIERTFAGNHLGHFLLTALLLDPLLRSPAARIIMLGSGAHGVTPPAGWIMTEKDYDRKRAYGSSKLANIMFTYELARRLVGTQVTVNALDPGGVGTRLGLNNGLRAYLKHVGYYLMRGQLRSSKRASAGVVYLATSAEMEGKSGGYYFDNRPIESSSISYDAELAQSLWALSVKSLRLDPQDFGSSWRYIAPAAGAIS